MRSSSQGEWLFRVEEHTVGEEYDQLDQVDFKEDAKTGDGYAS